MKRKVLRQRFQQLKKKKSRWLLAAGLVLLVVFFVTGDTGFYTQLRLTRRKHLVEKKIVEAQRRQVYLEQKIDSLKNDLEAIEKEAREEIKMGKKDEVIITFEEP